MPPTEKLVLMAIADHADSSGVCYPGQTGLAEKCCISRRTVIRITQQLENKKMLMINHRSGNGEGRKSNIYTLPLSDNLALNPLPQSDKLTQGQSDTHVTSKVTPMSPKPSDKPSDIKPKGKHGTKKNKYSAKDYEVGQWMFGLVLKINPAHSEPNYEAWANTVRLMREVDKRTHRQIAEVFMWANQDDFWKTNVLCPDKLRKQWDKLETKRINNNGSHTGQNTKHQDIHRDTYREIAIADEMGGGNIRETEITLQELMDEASRRDTGGY